VANCARCFSRGQDIGFSRSYFGNNNCLIEAACSVRNDCECVYGVLFVNSPMCFRTMCSDISEGTEYSCQEIRESGLFVLLRIGTGRWLPCLNPRKKQGIVCIINANGIVYPYKYSVKQPLVAESVIGGFWRSFNSSRKY